MCCSQRLCAECNSTRTVEGSRDVTLCAGLRARGGGEWGGEAVVRGSRGVGRGAGVLAHRHAGTQPNFDEILSPVQLSY
jgi:hypothetical protein